MQPVRWRTRWCEFAQWAVIGFAGLLAMAAISELVGDSEQCANTTFAALLLANQVLYTGFAGYVGLRKRGSQALYRWTAACAGVLGISAVCFSIFLLPPSLKADRDELALAIRIITVCLVGAVNTWCVCRAMMEWPSRRAEMPAHIRRVTSKVADFAVVTAGFATLLMLAGLLRVISRDTVAATRPEGGFSAQVETVFWTLAPQLAGIFGDLILAVTVLLLPQAVWLALTAPREAEVRPAEVRKLDGEVKASAAPVKGHAATPAAMAFAVVAIWFWRAARRRR